MNIYEIKRRMCPIAQFPTNIKLNSMPGVADNSFHLVMGN